MSESSEPKRLPLPRRRSVRLRLLALALLPTVVVLPVLLWLAAQLWISRLDSLLITKVSGDLTIARQYLNRIMEHGDDEMAALAQSAALQQALANGRASDIESLLAARMSALQLDFLYLVGPDGHVHASAAGRAAAAVAPRTHVVESAFAGHPATDIGVLSGEELRALAPSLEVRARLDLVDTPAAAPTSRTSETRGMVVQSATPVALPDGERLAVVGGTLLNQNLKFIDTINDLVYMAASLPEGSQGTATLFLDDVRISTNVRLFAGARALGTRVSKAVREAVLEQGRTWLDRAFVVNDWYISAYEPIVDGNGARIGMLYVGFLEKPFRDAKRSMLGATIAAFTLAALIVVPVLLRWARSIFYPLERMSRTIELVERGDMSARTGKTERDDEIARVAEHLDTLLDALQDRDRTLRDWANELDLKVAERTKELLAANERLEAAQRQLVMSEKLAAIGEITAGVAHEINNPIAVIQGNLDVAREVLGTHAEPVSNELALIAQQVHRMNLIVTKLLQFAKPGEFAGYAERVAPAEVLDDSVVLVQVQLGRSSIKVERYDAASHLVEINRTELQQVLINLMVNAIHAMPEGGTLRLATRDDTRDDIDGVVLEVSDTGVGIARENIDKIFNAFFTTRPQRGTGLGLSISATLMARYGGRITAQSEPGKGSTFSVWLPTGPAPAV